MSIVILSGVSRLEGLVWGVRGDKKAWIRKLGYKGPVFWPSSLEIENQNGWKAVVFKTKEDAEKEWASFSLVLDHSHLIIEDRGQVFVTE